MSETKIEMVGNEDEIETIDERQDLLSKGKRVVKRRSAKVTCCKFVLIAVAVGIFIAMLVQIWVDYGSYLETHSLPPRLHSMSSHCDADPCMTKSYNAPSCVWNNTVITCETSKPSHHMVATNHDFLIANMTWHDALVITFTSKPERCLHLTIWSI
jgi:hypothetical protein